MLRPYLRQYLPHSRLADPDYLRSVVLGGSSRYRHSPAAAAAPMSGPNQYTAWACQSHAISAGPNARAGFITAPVSAPPPPSAPTNTTRPTANPSTRSFCGETQLP